MENTEESQYEVVITDPAEIAFYEILGYLYENYDIDRAEEIADELRDTAKSLCYQPERGTKEPKLRNRKEDYRFILYERTFRAEIKIIYYLDQENEIVNVTDFFPTEKDNSQIARRR